MEPRPPQSPGPERQRPVITERRIGDNLLVYLPWRVRLVWLVASLTVVALLGVASRCTSPPHAPPSASAPDARAR